MKHLTFGQLGEIFDGPHATPTRQAGDGPYFLNISSLQNGRLDLSLSDRVSRADFEMWTRRVTPQKEDLLFSYETRLGEAALMPDGVEACLGRRMALLRPDLNVVDPRFLLYYYLSPAFQATINERTIHGATVPRVPLSTMGDWPVVIPDLAEQRAIAEVLGALDDKIAANTEIQSAAHSMSAALFLQARASATRSVSYEQVATVAGGGTPSTKVQEYWGGDIAWVTPTDVTALEAPYIDRSDRTITQQGFDACASALHPPGSILMTSRATIGAFAVAMTPVAVNQGFIVANARNPQHQWWLFHEMRTRVNDYVARANGATFLELSRGRFREMELLWPDEERVFTRFADKVRPLHERAYQAMTESRLLVILRDSLLPHLMSGSITVRQAEAVAAEAT